MLVDDGRLERVDGRWVAVGDLDNITVPPGIHALLAARLELLDSARALPARPRRRDGADLLRRRRRRALASRPGRRIPSMLLELVRKELIRPTRSDFGDEEAFEFRHLLIRDAAYDGVTKETRADLHARFADWLEAQCRRSAGRVRGDRRLAPRARRIGISPSSVRSTSEVPSWRDARPTALPGQGGPPRRAATPMRGSSSDLARWP